MNWLGFALRDLFAVTLSLYKRFCFLPNTNHKCAGKPIHIFAHKGLDHIILANDLRLVELPVAHRREFSGFFSNLAPNILTLMYPIIAGRLPALVSFHWSLTLTWVLSKYQKSPILLQKGFRQFLFFLQPSTLAQKRPVVRRKHRYFGLLNYIHQSFFGIAHNNPYEND